MELVLNWVLSMVLIVFSVGVSAMMLQVLSWGGKSKRVSRGIIWRCVWIIRFVCGGVATSLRVGRAVFGRLVGRTMKTYEVKNARYR